MKINMESAVNKISDDIVSKFNPIKIVLFGSVATGLYRKNSDIDLCIIKDTSNKRVLSANIYTEVDSDVPFDIIVYTNEEWERNIKDISSFAYLINKLGVVLYG